MIMEKELKDFTRRKEATIGIVLIFCINTLLTSSQVIFCTF